MIVSMAKPLVTCSSTSQYGTPFLFLAIAKKKASSCCFRKIQLLLPPNIKKTKRNSVVVHNSVQPGVPLPPEPHSWKSWIVAIVFAVVLSFLTNKWGPFFKLKNKVETTVETAEDIVNAVEKVAEGVEKVAEEIADQLPESGKLKNVVISVEKLAEAADKEAHLAGSFIEKMEDVEIKVESFVDSVIDEAKEPAKGKQPKDLK